MQRVQCFTGALYPYKIRTRISALVPSKEVVSLEPPVVPKPFTERSHNAFIVKHGSVSDTPIPSPVVTRFARMRYKTSPRFASFLSLSSTFSSTTSTNPPPTHKRKHDAAPKNRHPPPHHNPPLHTRRPLPFPRLRRNSRPSRSLLVALPRYPVHG